MTLLEFAEKTSPTPLTAWQRDFLTKYEQAVKEGKWSLCSFPSTNEAEATMSIIHKYYPNPPAWIWRKSRELVPIEVYCQGTKKIGIPCRRYLGKVEGKAELLCPICKTLNVVENGNVTIKERGK